jgi:hypothetical protein
MAASGIVRTFGAHCVYDAQLGAATQDGFLPGKRGDCRTWRWSHEVR